LSSTTCGWLKIPSPGHPPIENKFAVVERTKGLVVYYCIAPPFIVIMLSMLVIRTQQLTVFERDARRAFEDRLVSIVASEYPPSYEVLGEPGTRQLIRRAIALGEANRIVTEGGVTALTGLMIQFGETFDRAPDRDWAREILANPNMPGRLKVDLLLERMAGRTQGRVVVAEHGA